MHEIIGREPSDFNITRLTWDGHEFLDFINNDTVWNKTKKLFASNGISMTIELIKSVATDATTSILESSLGN